MPDLGPYSGFILASYAVAAVLLLGITASSLLAFRAAKARLAALEARKSAS